MVFGLFGNKSKKDDYNAGSDDAAATVVRNAPTIRTVAPVSGFVRLEEAQLTKEKEMLKKRKEYGKRFQQLLALRSEWEDIDETDNKSLYAYLSTLHKSIVSKKAARAALQVSMERDRLPLAKAEQMLSDTRAQVNAEIEALRNTRKENADRLRDRQR